MSNENLTKDELTPGERLRDARKIKNVKAVELCASIGMKQAMLSKIENGKGTITQDNLIAIKKYLKVNLDWLLTGEGEMFLGESPSAAASSLTGKTCPECGQKYGLEELAKEKDERLETQKRHISLLERETQRLERENAELKKNGSCVERVEKKAG